MKELIANRTWDNFHFPEWVPEATANIIKEFWSERCGRGPADWIESATYYKAPKFGIRVQIPDFSGDLKIGRYLHAWNNIGRVVGDMGEVYYVSMCDKFLVFANGEWRNPQPSDYQQSNVNISEMFRESTNA